MQEGGGQRDEAEKRSEGAWEQSGKDPVVNRVGRAGKTVWLLLVRSLLMGQHELNAAAAIVCWKHRGKQGSAGELGERI